MSCRLQAGPCWSETNPNSVDLRKFKMGSASVVHKELKREENINSDIGIGDIVQVPFTKEQSDRQAEGLVVEITESGNLNVEIGDSIMVSDLSLSMSVYLSVLSLYLCLFRSLQNPVNLYNNLNTQGIHQGGSCLYRKIGRLRTERLGFI